MKIAVPKELHDGENRVAMSPDMAMRLVKMGHTVILETGAGTRAMLPNELYEKAGALIGEDANETYTVADIVLKVRPPIGKSQESDELAMIKPGTLLVGLLVVWQMLDNHTRCLLGWLIGWLIGCVVACLVDWLVACLVA